MSPALDLSRLSTTTSPLDAARTLAAQGLPVFPVFGKTPLTPHGVYSASCDPNVFLRFDWNGDGCGVATGSASGIDVLDVDVRDSHARLAGDREGSSPACGCGGVDGFATIAGLGELPETLAASTPNGGRHFWFRHIPGSRSRRLGAGVEWFSDKKLVVVPPAPGRAWLNDAPIAEAPDWLRQIVLSTRRGMGREDFSGPQLDASAKFAVSTDPGARQVPKPIYFLILRTTAKNGRVQRRVMGLWSNLVAKREGRNDGLNFTAWTFRQLVAGGDLQPDGACALLWLACEANGYLVKDGVAVVRGTILRGLGLSEWPSGADELLPKPKPKPKRKVAG
jgi:Bifunctional DNA primase/polymerase, N-terminal